MVRIRDYNRLFWEEGLKGEENMQNMISYENLIEVLKQEEIALVYASSPTCSVCHVDYPKVKEIADRLKIMSYHVDVEKMPMAAGQLSLFSVPTVILYYKGKEYHRQARIIDFRELEYRMQQIKG